MASPFLASSLQLQLGKTLGGWGDTAFPHPGSNGEALQGKPRLREQSRAYYRVTILRLLLLNCQMNLGKYAF